jgi:FKBP-type peptidyl-prolyl cis-trans isomerase SlyD
MKRIIVISAVGIGVVAVSLLAFKFLPIIGKEGRMIENGSVVSIEYTLSDEGGTVIESNKGKDPLTYTHGEGQIIPGLEKGLSGMHTEEQKKIRIEPEDAYGPVNPQAYQEVPRADVPAEALKLGAMLVAKSQDGTTFPTRIREIKEQTVVLDFNHPLAGKTLNFDVKILDVQPPASE